jgi:small-conductance mechanosensitive channel
MGYIVADVLVGLDYGDRVAIVSVAVAVVLAVLVDRTLRRAQATRIVRDRLDASADTRLRFLRRVIEVTIVSVGVAIALSQYTALDKLATSLLASGAIAAAVIGFAARQTLANLIAGILLAVTQPLRLGDVVTFEGETGTVEDVRLTYTFLRTPSGTRVVIPNERLAAGILHNDTVLGRVTPEASLWVSRDTDVEAAIAAIAAGEGVADVTVAESTADGVRLAVTATAIGPGTRAQREAELRRWALRAVATDRAQAGANESM